MNSLQVAAFPFAYTNLTNAWGDFAWPLQSIGALFELHHKNAAALTSANQVILNGLMALAQHQAKFFNTTFDDNRKLTGDAMAGRSENEQPANPAETSPAVYLSNVSHVRELSDIAIKTNFAAVDILNTRISEAFDEVKAAFAGPVAIIDEGSDASTGVTGEHNDMDEHTAPREEVKAKPGVKPRNRKSAAHGPKTARRRTSRK